MTIPGSIAWHELEWSMSGRSMLSFRKIVHVGQLVFKYDATTYEWTPYWVMADNDGMYEIIAAHGNEKIEGVPASKLGIAVYDIH